jgi:hypothetical protein
MPLMHTDPNIGDITYCLFDLKNRVCIDDHKDLIGTVIAISLDEQCKFWVQVAWLNKGEIVEAWFATWRLSLIKAEEEKTKPVVPGDDGARQDECTRSDFVIAKPATQSAPDELNGNGFEYEIQSFRHGIWGTFACLGYCSETSAMFSMADCRVARPLDNLRLIRSRKKPAKESAYCEFNLDTRRWSNWLPYA